jgi:hypothetical protein
MGGLAARKVQEERPKKMVQEYDKRDASSDRLCSPFGLLLLELRWNTGEGSDQQRERMS